MDETTLNTFPDFIVTAGESTYEQISDLTTEEQQTYQRVKAGGLLLEQEKISHPHAVQVLSKLLSSTVIENSWIQ
jgi:hypothetical protein